MSKLTLIALALVLLAVVYSSAKPLQEGAAAPEGREPVAPEGTNPTETETNVPSSEEKSSEEEGRSLFSIKALEKTQKPRPI